MKWNCFLPRKSNLIFFFWNDFFNGPQNKLTGSRGCGENLIHFYYFFKNLKQQFLTQPSIISLNCILNNSSLRANIKSAVQRWWYTNIQGHSKQWGLRLWSQYLQKKSSLLIRNDYLVSDIMNISWVTSMFITTSLETLGNEGVLTCLNSRAGRT